ncbi:hypothetical protein F4779DRAFT_597903 [Xylariaceae sp. FL0662B]|nr:hypothetical protein F4779DRAFT_597903 [Xylariaceae sp. FL0662B]
MEAALTFGSVGDIIALCQIAIQLGRALAGNSAKEYRDLRQDLDVFIGILVEVVAAYQQFESNPWLDGLNSATQSVVDQCTPLIKETLDRLQMRYGDSLQAAGSGKKVKDIYKKIEWSIREQDMITNLQDNLRKSVGRLTLLTTLAIKKSARVDNATMLARIEEVNELVSREEQARQDILMLLREQNKTSKLQATEIQAVGNRLITHEKTHEKGNWEILQTAKRCFSAVLEVKEILIKVSNNVANLQVLASNSMFLHPLDPTKGLPVILEDALGNILPIPMEWVDSLDWDVLHKLLEGRFRGGKGHEMVMRGQYVLEDNTTGQDLDKARPLSWCLRRGMKVNMSMVYDLETVPWCCPRCHTDLLAPDDKTIQCTNKDCGLWYHKVGVITAAKLSNAVVEPADVQKFNSRRLERVNQTRVELADLKRVRFCKEIGKASTHIVYSIHRKRDISFTCVPIRRTKDIEKEAYSGYFGNTKVANGLMRVSRRRLLKHTTCETVG